MTTEPRASLVEVEQREQIDAWLTANCGKGLPYGEATDLPSALHGLAYILRQIEGTASYKVHIGQCNSATSALRWALDHFALEALRAPADARARFALAVSRIERDTRLSELTEAEIDGLVEALRTQGDGESVLDPAKVQAKIQDILLCDPACNGRVCTGSIERITALVMQASRRAAPTQASSREEGE